MAIITTILKKFLSYLEYKKQIIHHQSKLRFFENKFIMYYIFVNFSVHI